ncbi:diguanylate cyclase (GGDEF) domain-containing protein [Pseudomonas cuatrocienegasensis]|uniref:diguanylate cyclase n=1 Tax=Pseudomonas cuatrocienegasensis TaxID=543360 RepID=A0ABY1BMI8_9PSED|nr:MULTISPECIES: GGDEF domain-containing protein [Pseudomonas]SER19262.1 diguanylate cyclase (GGDEF) domain-containing protein [Pseudomonas cuatrocienegasensis]
MHLMQQWFNKSLQRKIGSLLVVLLAFLFIVIVYSIYKLKLISAEMHEVADVDVPLTEMVSELEMMQLRQHLLIEKFRLEGNQSKALLTPEATFAAQRDALSFLLDKAVRVLNRSLQQHQVRFATETHQQILSSIEHYHKQSDIFEQELQLTLSQGHTAEQRWQQLEDDAARLDQSIISILQQMEKLTLEASRYTDKHESEFMLVNTGLGLCAFFIGLYLSFYILRIFRLRISRIQAEIKTVHQSIEQGEPIASPVFQHPVHQDELTELEHDLKMMVQRLSQEISNREEVEQQLLILATRDKLTGAFNRHKWDEQLRMELSLAERGNTFSIALLDVDFFKKVNDQFGHHVGDKVLQALTECISQRLRKTDSLFRLGGEEFVILLPQQKAEAACQVAETLRQQIEDLNIPELPRFTISFGVTEYHLKDDEDTILKRADQALYKAKNMGRNRVEVG